MLETLVSAQVKEYMESNSILSAFQFGFRKQHSTTTTAMKVVHDILDALNRKQCCLSLFIDFSKAFDTVDHSILPDHLKATGLSDHAVRRFANDLSGRTQAVQAEGVTSNLLQICKRFLKVQSWDHHFLKPILIALVRISKIPPFTSMLMTLLFTAVHLCLNKLL